MKIFSQLEKAQIENLTADPTGTGLIVGRAWFRTDTTKFKLYDGTIVREYVDLDSTQSLSAKTLTNPTISGSIIGTQIATPSNPSAGFNKLYPKADNMMYFLNSAGTEKVLIDGSSTQTMSGKTLTDPTLSASLIGTQIATPSAPASGFNKLYPKSDGKWYNQTSAGVETELGAGGGSGINYITFPSGDTGVGTWVISKNTSAAATPDNGFVTSGITGTFATTGTTPHRGTASFLWTLGALGEQISIPFTIDNEDKGKVLQGTLSYSVVSGTYADNIHAWIYDVTNAVFIQPAPYKILNSGIIEKFAFEFQTSSSSTSYKLVLHQAVAGTPVVKLDSFSVGPQAKLYGSPVTDFVSYTPTMTNDSGTFTNVTVTGKWRRIGDSAEIIVRLVHSGTPGTFSGINFSLPSGLSIDTTKVPNDKSTRFGIGAVLDSGTLTYDALVYTNGTSTSVAVVPLSASGTFSSVSSFSQTQPMSWAVNDELNIRFTVPILGWASSQIMSSDADTRVISVAANGDPAATTAGNPIIFPSIIWDTHSAYNISTGRFTCPKPGFVRVHGFINAATNNAQITIYKNALAYINAGNTNSNGDTAFTGVAQVVAGDLLDIRPSVNIDADGNSQLFFEYIQGPAQIAASEIVHAHYTTAAGASIANSGENAVTFGTKVSDSHGAYSGSTFTAPTNGIYLLKSVLWFSSAAYATANAIFLIAYKNGASFRYGPITNVWVAGTGTVGVGISCEIPLLAGETAELRVTNNRTAGATTLDAQAKENYLSITKVGNYV